MSFPNHHPILTNFQSYSETTRIQQLISKSLFNNWSLEFYDPETYINGQISATKPRNSPRRSRDDIAPDDCREDLTYFPALCKARNYISIMGGVLRSTRNTKRGILPTQTAAMSASELKEQLSQFWSDPEWMWSHRNAEWWNSFRGIDLSCGWSRLYHMTERWFDLDERRHLRELRVKGQEERTRVGESFARFNWKMQYGPLILAEEWFH